MDDTAAFTMRELYDSRPLPTPTPDPEPGPRQSVVDAIRGVPRIRVADALRSMDEIADLFDRLTRTPRWDGRRQQDLLAPALDSYALDDVPPLRWMWPSLSCRPMTWAEACEAMRLMDEELLAMASD